MMILLKATGYQKQTILIQELQETISSTIMFRKIHARTQIKSCFTIRSILSHEIQPSVMLIVYKRPQLFLLYFCTVRIYQYLLFFRYISIVYMSPAQQKYLTISVYHMPPAINEVCLQTNPRHGEFALHEGRTKCTQI